MRAVQQYQQRKHAGLGQALAAAGLQRGHLLRPVDNPPPVHSYAKGTMGPSAADDLVASYGDWHKPWGAA